MIRQLSKHSRTVWGEDNRTYASQDIKKGETVEVAPVIPIPSKGSNSYMGLSGGYRMHLWWDQEADLIAAGMGTITGYGFSLQPNTQATMFQSSRYVVMNATRDIRAGEHLTRADTVYEDHVDDPVESIQLPDPLEVNPIEVTDTKFGKGVVATRLIREGELVEESAALPVPPQERMQSGRAGFKNYSFWWGDDKQGTRFKPHAIALGYLGIVNHSSTDPNVDHIPDWYSIEHTNYRLHKDAVSLFQREKIRHFAIRDIQPGEELFKDYGWGSNDPRLR